MNITLTHDGDVPLRQQLSEQIAIVELVYVELVMDGVVFGALKVHHNTVSKAYQELVRREWFTRKRGSRLVVGSPGSKNQRPDSGLEALGLDALINETIQRAKSLGYSLQTLRSRVCERLLAEPADHLLVVEDEPGLRLLIQLELEGGDPMAGGVLLSRRSCS